MTDCLNNEILVRYSGHWASKEQISKSLLFRCFPYSDVHYSDPHCENRMRLLHEKDPSIRCQLLRKFLSLYEPLILQLLGYA